MICNKLHSTLIRNALAQGGTTPITMAEAAALLCYFTPENGKLMSPEAQRRHLDSQAGVLDILFIALADNALQNPLSRKEVARLALQAQKQGKQSIEASARIREGGYGRAIEVNYYESEDDRLGRYAAIESFEAIRRVAFDAEFSDR